MTKDSIQEFRHEIRTHMNHIAAYGELLEDDIREVSLDELLPDVQRINQENKNLLQLLERYFYGEHGENPEIELFSQGMIGPVYTIIGLATGMIQSCLDLNVDFFVPDLEKMVHAAQELLKLFQKDLGQGYTEKTFHVAQTDRNNPSSEPESEEEEITGRILIVDDNDLNRDILSRHLERQGHHVEKAPGGAEALELLSRSAVDLILLDIMMPGINGYQVLEKVKKNSTTRHIPVIMISALDEMESLIRCIQMGAEDYLPKSFDPILLKARISACLEKKHLRDQEALYISALIESQQALQDELAEAAQYVKSLLPEPVSTGFVETNWRFIPSAQLGGDCFGYHQLDQDHFAFYLLDVSGHGIGAALLSVSVMNVLRTQSLTNTNFHDPTSVLGGLNRTFQMENQNNMYFTVWYGVMNLKTRQLEYGCGGAPPAMHLRFQGEEAHLTELATEDMIIGLDSEYLYETRKIQVQPGDKLYLFSDGVFEIRLSNGKMMEFSEFRNLVESAVSQDGSSVESLFEGIKRASPSNVFDDDFSLLELIFK